MRLLTDPIVVSAKVLAQLHGRTARMIMHWPGGVVIHCEPTPSSSRPASSSSRRSTPAAWTPSPDPLGPRHRYAVALPGESRLVTTRRPATPKTDAMRGELARLKARAAMAGAGIDTSSRARR